MNEREVRVSVLVDEELKEELVLACKELKVTLSQVTRGLYESWLEKAKKQLLEVEAIE